jgi:hypothetical protein
MLKRHRNNQVIKFWARDEHTWNVKERPRPASEFVPKWWKDMSPYTGPMFDMDPAPNVTAKKCFPLLDGLTAGYIVPLWSDVLIQETNEGFPLAKWGVEEQVLDTWGSSQTQGFEIPDGYHPLVFKNLHRWIIETSPGYSCLITHPIGYPNLPFRSITGIIDTDKLKTDANTPFVIKRGFQGIIERGTPMFQVIPFKRDKWTSEFGLKNPNEIFYEHEKLISRMMSSYGRFLREPKHYK